MPLYPGFTSKRSILDRSLSLTVTMTIWLELAVSSILSFTFSRRLWRMRQNSKFFCSKAPGQGNAEGDLKHPIQTSPGLTLWLWPFEVLSRSRRTQFAPAFISNRPLSIFLDPTVSCRVNGLPWARFSTKIMILWSQSICYIFWLKLSFYFFKRRMKSCDTTLKLYFGSRRGFGQLKFHLL